jgi:hypothetical protein
MELSFLHTQVYFFMAVKNHIKLHCMLKNKTELNNKSNLLVF